MRGERIVIDGLWRCLCPSADIATISKLLGPPHNPPQRPILSSSSRNAQITQSQGRREYRAIPSPPNDPKRDDHEYREHERIQYLTRLAKRSPWIPDALFKGVDSFITKLDRIPTETIYASLKELTRAESTYFSIVKLVEYLITVRKEKPNAVLYESLIRANVDKKHGSAEVASKLLKEMEKLRISITPQVYQAVLDVTAVHPDYVLRNTALFEMKNRWYTPTPDDLISIIIGLLRDNQYELALEKLEELQKDPVYVPLWLYDIFLYTFGDLGFQDEVLSILKHRLKVSNLTDEPLSLNTWQFLLDVFSRDSFYSGIKYIWDHSVSLGYLHPPDGVVMGTLNAASNHGDTALAVSAIQTLSRRGKKLELHHYEALMDIHVRQKDLARAFTTLCIMAKANLYPDLSSTRSIFRVLRESSSDTNNSIDILNELRLHYQVPPAAFNVVLETILIHRGFQVALDLYRSVRQICAGGPDLETYHVLLAHCTARRSMNFLYEEMKAFSIEPSETVYNHLIRISSMQDNYEQAFYFLDKMRSSETAGLSNNWFMNRDSALALLRRCIQEEDMRAHDLIEECRKRDLNIDAEVQQLLDAVQAQKEAAKSNPSNRIRSPPRADAMSGWG